MTRGGGGLQGYVASVQHSWRYGSEGRGGVGRKGRAHGKVYCPRRSESECSRRAAGERCARGVLAERGSGMSNTDAVWLSA